MNFLAHAYLSFQHPEILVGNMISDFVKGKKKFDYPAAILKGIMLHRAIDEYTDRHPATKQAAGFFHTEYRLYSSAFIDIVYDHFLANDLRIFTPSHPLEAFAADTYRQLEPLSNYFPTPFYQMFPYMKSQNWLLNYRHTWGIQNSFKGLVSRAAYLSDAATAQAIFLEKYSALEACYNAFFPSLEQFAAQQYRELLMND